MFNEITCQLPPSGKYERIITFSVDLDAEWKRISKAADKDLNEAE